MTEKERDILIAVLKRDVPYYYARLRQKAQLKKEMILKCISLASNCDNDEYQVEINKVCFYSQTRLSNAELILLNYICLIRHKEHIYKGTLQIDDEETQKWIEVLKMFIEDELVFSLLKQQSHQLISRYRIKRNVGRPLNSGKKVFTYNGKVYHTIQECADEYGITKQGMHKRLRKLNII